MRTPLQSPAIAELAPTDETLTAYDEELRVIYLRLLDANAASADWREVARLVLNLDPDSNPVQARRTWESHLRRAAWMADYGFQFFLE